MLTNYIDFEITFQQRNGVTFPFLADSSKGQANGELADLSADATFQELLVRLRANDTDEDMLIALGRRLYDALFRDRVRDRFVATQGGQEGSTGIRLKLRTAPGDTLVGALPWEYLYEPNRENPFVLLDISVVRYPQAPIAVPNLAAKLPLRVLLTAAQPKDKSATYADRELDFIRAALQERGLETDGQFEIVEERHLTRSKFQRLLRQGFQIWHFAGHGAISRDGTSGTLLFEDQGGSAEPVSARELGLLMANSGVRLILLDACESGTLALDSFRSVAPALIANGIGAVIAMQFTVYEESTTAFAGEFYAALAEGLPVDACVTEGRRAVMGVAGLRRPDWGIPVVYTRAPDGVLFKLPEKPVSVVPPTTAPNGVNTNFSGATISGGVNITTGDTNVIGNTFNSGAATTSDADVVAKRNALNEQIGIKKRRLYALQKQAAMYGIGVDPSISIQIEDLEQEIAKLEAQLARTR